MAFLRSFLPYTPPAILFSMWRPVDDMQRFRGEEDLRVWCDAKWKAPPDHPWPNVVCTRLAKHRGPHYDGLSWFATGWSIPR